MYSITFDTLRPLSSAQESCISLFPSILALRDIWVHVHTSNSSNVVSYIEISVNKPVCLTSALDIPNIQPNDHYIQFRWHFDDSGFWSNYDVIENIIVLNDHFNNIC